MKSETKENIIIPVAIVLGVVAAVAVAVVLALHGITLSFKAFNLGFSVATVFGILGYVHRDDLKRSLRTAVTFGVLVAVHVLVYLDLFRHGIGTSSAAIGFTGIPEVGVAGVILILVGGAKHGYLKVAAGSHGQRRSHHGLPPSGTTHGKSKSK